MIVIDPMLATGRSLIDALKTLARNGEPAHIHIACVIATPEGLQYVANNLKPIGVPYTIWSFSVDERLDERFYIVPGLGDAGDLSFGNKI